jgi:hypothetical protein
MEILLKNLEPCFLKIIDEKTYRYVDATIQEADGISFFCPLCFHNNNDSNVGTHQIWCWKPSVPQTFFPIPGRWYLIGTSFDDLSLIGSPSSSIKLGNGSNVMSKDDKNKNCNAHFNIINGKVIW